MRDDPGRPRDILDAICAVEKYVERGRAEFDQSELIQVWIVHHLQVIGEAARGLTGQLRIDHPEVPWVDIIAMRNLLVHKYFGIDLQEIWDTAVNDLPALRKRVEVMMRLGEDSGAGSGDPSV